MMPREVAGKPPCCPICGGKTWVNEIGRQCSNAPFCTWFEYHPNVLRMMGAFTVRESKRDAPSSAAAVLLLYAAASLLWGR